MPILEFKPVEPRKREKTLAEREDFGESRHRHQATPPPAPSPSSSRTSSPAPSQAPLFPHSQTPVAILPPLSHIQIEESVSQPAFNLHDQLQKLLEKIRRGKTGRPPTKFQEKGTLPPTFFGTELDNGTFGYVQYCRGPRNNMGESVAKLFYDPGDLSIREIYCLWVLQGSSRIPELQSVIKQTLPNGEETVLGYVMPCFKSTLRHYFSTKNSVRRDRASVRTEAEQIFRILQDVAEALAHMHRHHIAHLDLCDVNVMVHVPNEPTSSKQTVSAKLIDFGSARFFGCKEAPLYAPDDDTTDPREQQTSRLIKIPNEIGHVTYK